MKERASRDSHSLTLPPEPLTESGQPRRVGVELEFAGLDIDRAAKVVAEHFKADIEHDTDYEKKIGSGELGDWIVEVDFELLKFFGRKARSDDDDPTLGFEVLDEIAEELLARSSLPFVPLEVVSPPIPMDRLHEVNALIAALRQAGALGTGESWAYAFGMHMNPELPALDPGTITRYLQAFFCLYDWLIEHSDIDSTRRLTPYIDPFPREYVRTVVAADYRPDRDALIDDYLAANPTRNRILDMLPLFSHLDADRVTARVDDPRIKSRPTLHYRLPNCEIDRQGWDLSGDWNRWLEVERLAADPERLNGLCQRYEQHLQRGAGLFSESGFRIDPERDLIRT